MSDFVQAFYLLNRIFEIKITLLDTFQFTIAEMTCWFFAAALIYGSVNNMMFNDGGDE